MSISGMLWVSSRWRERLPATSPTYLNLAAPNDGLDAVAHATPARHDASAQSVETITAAYAALDVLAAAGWSAVHERATELAAALAAELTAHGREVAPRECTTLVSWRDRDPPATRALLAEARRRDPRPARHRPLAGVRRGLERRV